MDSETNNSIIGNELTKEVASLFESLKHINEEGVEYWSARELYPHLGYARWQRFEETVEKAKESCKSASQRIEVHFTNVGKIVKAGVSTKTKADVHMTRYACYLVAQTGDPRKTSSGALQWGRPPRQRCYLPRNRHCHLPLRRNFTAQALVL